MANKLKEAFTKKMTVFDKLKEMSEKELYNFLVINDQYFLLPLRQTLSKELKKGNFDEVANIIHGAATCRLCAFRGSCFQGSCASGKEEFLLKEWKGYYIE